MTGLVAHGLTVAIETPTGPVTVVDGVDLSVAAGRCTALVGESGSGKTLTALSLVRLLPTGAHITAGRVDLHSADGSVVDVRTLDDASLRRVRGRRIAMIFQEPMTALNPLMRIHDQVGEGLQTHQGLRRREARSRATALLERVGVPAWRASAFPVLRDLIVDRTALDRIIAAGGFISAPTGSAQDGNAIPIPKDDSDLSMDAAQCIGCGACVAACPNASAMLFTAAKVSHLGRLPQGQPERHRRVLAMVSQMDAEGFGGCTNYGECQEACPKEISVETIARMNRDWVRATLTDRGESRAEAGVA